MKYGKEVVTKFLDERGSTETYEYNYRDGEAARPVRRRREIRHQADADPYAVAADILKSQLSDTARLDCTIKLERKKTKAGVEYLHLVECYTTLEY